MTGATSPAGPRALPAVGLSTTAVFPDGVTTAFSIAAELGYDGIEVMVWSDPASQDTDGLAALSSRFALPVLSVHAPTTLLTQRVWGTNPWGKLRRTAEHAESLGADVVVVHPPFLWQRRFGLAFAQGIAQLGEEHHVTFAVENMFPWRVGGARLEAYSPGWDPTHHDYDHMTLDMSHTATAQVDALDLALAWGDRLRHVHLADGSGSIKDEHLPPGRGNQPCAEVLQHLAQTGWAGHVVAEVNTRRSPSRRTSVLAETLAFARTHLGQEWSARSRQVPADPAHEGPGAPA